MCDHIGILEQGRLLATGSVDQIRKGLQATRDIVVKVAGEPESAMKVLGMIDTVKSPVVDGMTIRFSMDGGDEDQIQILRKLTDARIEVLEYTSHTESLEDVFLKVTQGRVQ